MAVGGGSWDIKAETRQGKKQRLFTAQGEVEATAIAEALNRAIRGKGE